jgi:hypothetical protein
LVQKKAKAPVLSSNVVGAMDGGITTENVVPFEDFTYTDAIFDTTENSDFGNSLMDRKRPRLIEDMSPFESSPAPHIVLKSLPADAQPVLKRGRQQTDSVLTELASLRQRLQRVEDQSSVTNRENRLLWDELLQSRERQLAMKQKIRRLYYYVYQLYASAVKHGMLPDRRGSGSGGSTESSNNIDMLQLVSIVLH